MLKVKKIKISAFRGILKPQTLDFTNDGQTEPANLVLYGLNSSGKTSFVDSLEWFFSNDDSIEWLAREDAKEKAYPHQAAGNAESYVELDFADTEKKLSLLKKTYNPVKRTAPDLSSPQDFQLLYGSFVIRPYLRYMEVVDFVLNKRGVEKYQKLASWMGFETELSFQEKISLKILPRLKNASKELELKVQAQVDGLHTLIADQDINDKNVLSYVNSLFSIHKIPAAKSLTKAWENLETLNGLKVSSALSKQIDRLSAAEVSLTTKNVGTSIIEKIEAIETSIKEISKDQILFEKIDTIDLYTKASELIVKSENETCSCPVCGNEWDKTELLEHIKNELDTLQKLKEAREELKQEARSLRLVVSQEQQAARDIRIAYANVLELVPTLESKAVVEYEEKLKTLSEGLLGDILDSEFKFNIKMPDVESTGKEKLANIKLISEQKTKLQPSKEDVQLSENAERIASIKTLWGEHQNNLQALTFLNNELESFTHLCNELARMVQANVKGRFDQISTLICSYFNILRKDKDIKDIEIVLNEDKGKAAGRSAEIQLSYYEIAVKPAYKVLSESLLNSLGLAVYFACIKQFNDKSKFIILDDIMNSLDIQNRDTVLDLIEQEFSDYQIILFTHDLFWFKKIQRRFPNWICKKIKNWEYETGPEIDFEKTTRQDIEELLKDSTKIEDGGAKLGKHIEGCLNELCENTAAEIRYRYLKSDTPAMEELFEALYKRLKSKLGATHPAVEQLLKAKQFEPLLRNFTSHPQGHMGTTISPSEVKRAMEEWFAFEETVWCTECNRYIEYFKDKDSFECKKTHLKLTKVP